MRGLKGLSKYIAPESVSDTVCYCDGKREIGTLEILCSACLKWFHKRCLKDLKDFCGLSFMVCYVFHCKDCSPTGVETWVAKQAYFSDMCITALANLTAEKLKDGHQKTGEHIFFSLQDTIIPYFDAKWEHLTSMPRRINNTWHTTLQKTLNKDVELFKVNPKDENSFALMETNLAYVCPLNQSVKQCEKKISIGEKENLSSTMVGDHHGMNETSVVGFHIGTGPTTRANAKRRGVDVVGGWKKPNLSTNYFSSKLASCDGYRSIKFPFNREGYRYFLAERDPHVPERLPVKDEDWYKPQVIPPEMYRLHIQPMVTISPNDRAHELVLSDDQLALTGFEGYRVARATHAVAKGTWYFEVHFLEQPEGSHIRIGWSQNLAVVQSCVGYNKLSYSWRSLKGTKFHAAIGKRYHFDGFKEGDILGCLIHLPHDPCHPGPSERYLPPSHKDLTLIEFKRNYFYESYDDVASALESLEPLKGSRIEFFKNGKSCGVAFTDIYGGFYYPAVSLYKNATIRLNFGPTMQCLPAGALPMSSRVEELYVEQALSDTLFLVSEGHM